MALGISIGGIAKSSGFFAMCVGYDGKVSIPLWFIHEDRKKLGMDSADPQNRSEWRGSLRERLVKKAQPSVEENRALKWI